MYGGLTSWETILSSYLYQWDSGCYDFGFMFGIEGYGFEKTSGFCSQGGDSALHGWCMSSLLWFGG